MKHAGFIYICIIMLLSSCTKSYLDHVDNSSGESLHNVIGWNIYTEDHTDKFGPETRALVDDYSSLKNACTQTEYREAEKIGLLGKFTLVGSSSIVFDNVDLWWWLKEDGNPYIDQEGDNSCWNYPGTNVYWTDNAEYTFKAYYPKSKVQLQPGSNADKLLAVYDTETSQYDFMLANKKLGAYEENPITLTMQHALAALKFDFQFVDDDVTDELLACWLENHDDDGFYTSSTLNYSNGIVWPKSTATSVGTAVYYWEPYVPLVITGDSPAEAYSTAAATGRGQIYTENSGWLLVIPQSSDVAGCLKLCFRTSTGGNTIYRVDLPAYEFLAGNRYTYHIKMTSTNIEVGLTIASWNERKSSYEIDFND